MDPLADMFGQQSVSPYSAFWNNPMRFEDKWGLAAGDSPTWWRRVRDFFTPLKHITLDEVFIPTSGPQKRPSDKDGGSGGSGAGFRWGSMIDYSGFYGGNGGGSENDGGGGNPDGGNGGNIEEVKYDGRAWFGTNFIGPGPDENPYLLSDTRRDNKYLMPKDMIDAAAQKHDFRYWQNKTSGITGALLDKRVAMADAMLVQDAWNILKGYQNGMIDPYTGVPISSRTAQTAYAVYVAFFPISVLKYSGIPPY